MKQKINLFVVCRILVGAFFVISGGHKLLSPYSNFLYVVQSYDILMPSLEKAAAWIVPWMEFLTGIFLIVGLWLRFSLQGLLTLIVFFILVVSQAVLRHLPLEECGCFGELFSLPLRAVLLMDTSLLLLTWVLWKNCGKTRFFSLDAYFDKK